MSRRVLIIGIVLFVAVWSGLFVYMMGQPLGRTFGGDAVGYSNGAVHIVQEGFYSLDGVKPQSDREPGYSLLLAVVYAIAGMENRAAVFIMQGLLYLLAAVTFARQLGRSVTPRAGGIAFLLLAVMPSGFHTIFFLNRECLALALFLLILALMLQLKERWGWTAAIGLGFLFGALLLTYIPLLFLPLFFVPVVLLWKMPKRLLIPLLVIPYIVVGLWGARNYAYTGHACLAGCERSSMYWYVRGVQSQEVKGLEPIRCLWAEYVSRDWTGRSRSCSFNRLMHELWTFHPPTFEEGLRLGAQGRQMILRNFGSYLWFSTVDVLELHLPYVNGWGRIYNILAALSTAILYIGILCALADLRRRWKFYALFVLPMLCVTGVFVLTDATPRYLMPVIGSYVALSAIGYDRVLERRRRGLAKGASIR